MFVHHFTAMRTNFVDCVEITMETLKMTSVPPLVNWSKALKTLVTVGTQTLSKTGFNVYGVIK